MSALVVKLIILSVNLITFHSAAANATHNSPSWKTTKTNRFKYLIDYGITFDNDRFIYLFGGSTVSFPAAQKNTLLKFDLIKKDWTDIFSNTPNPIARGMIEPVYHKGFVYISGGKGRWLFSDLWKFNIRDSFWSQIVPNNNQKILAGIYSSVFVRNDSVYFTGGATSTESNFSLLFSFDFAKFKILTRKPLSSSGYEGPYRSRVIYFPSKDFSVSYGGFNPYNLIKSDLFLLDCSGFKSSEDTAFWTNVTDRQSGDIPTEFVYNDAFRQEDDGFVLVGKSNKTNSSYLLNVTTFAWKRLHHEFVMDDFFKIAQIGFDKAAIVWSNSSVDIIRLKGDHLTIESLYASTHGISRRSAVCSGRILNYLIVWGGYTPDDEYQRTTPYVFDLNEKKWLKISDLGLEQPPNRRLAACTTSANRLYVHGGISYSDEVLDDFWFYSFADKSNGYWTKINSDHEFKKFGHTMTIFQSEIYFQGGSPNENDIVSVYDVDRNEWIFRKSHKMGLRFSSESKLEMRLNRSVISIWTIFGGQWRQQISDEIKIQTIRPAANKTSRKYLPPVTNSEKSPPGRYSSQTVLNGNNLLIFYGRNEMFFNDDISKTAINFRAKDKDNHRGGKIIFSKVFPISNPLLRFNHEIAYYGDTILSYFGSVPVDSNYPLVNSDGYSGEMSYLSLTPLCERSHITKYNLSAANNCYLCSAGFYHKEINYDGNVKNDVKGVMFVCEKCPRGTYSATQGSLVCQKCPKGTNVMAMEKAATNIQFCKPCRMGFYPVDDGCEECPPNMVCFLGCSAPIADVNHYLNTDEIQIPVIEDLILIKSVYLLVFKSLGGLVAFCVLLGVLSYLCTDKYSSRHVQGRHGLSRCQRALGFFTYIDFLFAKRHVTSYRNYRNDNLAKVILKKWKIPLGGLCSVIYFWFLAVLIINQVYDYYRNNEIITRSFNEKQFFLENKTRRLGGIQAEIILLDYNGVCDEECSSIEFKADYFSSEGYLKCRNSSSPDFSQIFPDLLQQYGKIPICGVIWFCQDCVTKNSKSELKIEFLSPPSYASLALCVVKTDTRYSLLLGDNSTSIVLLKPQEGHILGGIYPPTVINFGLITTIFDDSINNDITSGYVVDLQDKTIGSTVDFVNFGVKKGVGFVLKFEELNRLLLFNRNKRIDGFGVVTTIMIGIQNIFKVLSISMVVIEVILGGRICNCCGICQKCSDLILQRESNDFNEEYYKTIVDRFYTAQGRADD